MFLTIEARRMRALVYGLPPRGALHRSIDPEGWAWGQSEELLAATIESIDATNRILLAANGGKPSAPLQVRRPHDTRKAPSTMQDLLHIVKGDRQ